MEPDNAEETLLRAMCHRGSTVGTYYTNASNISAWICQHIKHPMVNEDIPTLMSTCINYNGTTSIHTVRFTSSFMDNLKMMLPSNIHAVQGLSIILTTRRQHVILGTLVADFIVQTASTTSVFSCFSSLKMTPIPMFLYHPPNTIYMDLLKAAITATTTYSGRYEALYIFKKDSQILFVRNSTQALYDVFEYLVTCKAMGLCIIEHKRGRDSHSCYELSFEKGTILVEMLK
jgi:hypothetical protein